MKNQKTIGYQNRVDPVKEVRIIIEIGPKGEADRIELEVAQYELIMEMQRIRTLEEYGDFKPIQFPSLIAKLTATCTNTTYYPYIIQKPKFKRAKKKK